jgi:hypothetical protein
VGGVLCPSYNKVIGIALVKREMMGNGVPVENPPQTLNLVLLQVKREMVGKRSTR